MTGAGAGVLVGGTAVAVGVSMAVLVAVGCKMDVPPVVAASVLSANVASSVRSSLVLAVAVASVACSVAVAVAVGRRRVGVGRCVGAKTTDATVGAAHWDYYVAQ